MNWKNTLINNAVALIGILIPVMIFFIWKHNKNKPVDLQKEADKVVNNERLQKVANEIAHHLGFKYAVVDPRRWTENDKEVFELLKTLSKTEVAQVSQLYSQVYARGRDLKSDLLKVLDSKLYEQLNNL